MLLYKQSLVKADKQSSLRPSLPVLVLKIWAHDKVLYCFFQLCCCKSKLCSKPLNRLEFVAIFTGIGIRNLGTYTLCFFLNIYRTYKTTIQNRKPSIVLYFFYQNQTQTTSRHTASRHPSPTPHPPRLVIPHPPHPLPSSLNYRVCIFK